MKRHSSLAAIAASAPNGKPVAPPTPASPGKPVPPTTPRRIPEYRPFPVEALPPVMRDVVKGTAVAVGCDPAYAALPALTLAGASVGTALAASPKRKFVELPALWAVVVGDSGTAKSPAADPFTDAACAIEEGLGAQYVSAREAYEQADDDGVTRRPEPVREYFLAGDVTIERLVENLKTSPRGLLVAQDELANWFGSFTRYKSGGGSDSGRWLSMFDGRQVSYQRRAGQPRDVSVKRALVSVTGGIQPGVLASVLSDPAYVASGLAARLVFAMPPKSCPRWTDVELDPDVESRFTAVVNFLRGIPFDAMVGPARVGLEYNALQKFIGFLNRLAEQAEGLDGGPMAAALPKLSRIALRLALIHHAVQHTAEKADPGRCSIGEASMGAGIVLAEWFAHEAERVYAMLGERPEERQLRTLAELVGRKGGHITPRELQRANSRTYPTSAAAELALDALVSADFGHWDESGRSRVFVLTTEETA